MVYHMKEGIVSKLYTTLSVLFGTYASEVFKKNRNEYFEDFNAEVFWLMSIWCYFGDNGSISHTIRKNNK